MTTEALEIRYSYGSAEALEAEYGIVAGAAFAFVQFYQGEISQWFPCATLAECRAELADVTDGPIEYLS